MLMSSWARKNLPRCLFDLAGHSWDWAVNWRQSQSRKGLVCQLWVQLNQQWMSGAELLRSHDFGFRVQLCWVWGSWSSGGTQLIYFVMGDWAKVRVEFVVVSFKARRFSTSFCLANSFSSWFTLSSDFIEYQFIKSMSNFEDQLFLFSFKNYCFLLLKDTPEDFWICFIKCDSKKSDHVPRIRPA